MIHILKKCSLLTQPPRTPQLCRLWWPVSICSHPCTSHEVRPHISKHMAHVRAILETRAPRLLCLELPRPRSMGSTQPTSLLINYIYIMFLGLWKSVHQINMYGNFPLGLVHRKRPPQVSRIHCFPHILPKFLWPVGAFFGVPTQVEN